MDKDTVSKQCKLLWFCFVFSLWIYVGAAWAVSHDGSPAGRGDYGSIRLIFYASSFLPILTIGILRRLVLKKTIKPAPVHTSWPELARNTILVSYAFAETPAVFGLILFCLTRQWLDFFVFLSLSAAALIFFYPRGLKNTD